ncbi:radical SAM protein [Streptomyces sp. PmtG]
MHLLDLLGARSTPGAALLLTLTRRCPLACAHCSTASTPVSEQLDARPLVDFVATFRADNRPDHLLLTGGEPLLRPRLVRRLARLARATGCRTQLQTGMFFARHDRVPAEIERALAAVDHVAASIDAFHEAWVPRDRVLAALRPLVDAGRDVSVQVTGAGADDPYLAEATDAVRRAFDDRVPVLVTSLRPAGRAAAWLPRTRPGAAPGSAPVRGSGAAADPCAMAAWPVVAFDGTVVACCNQDIVDGGAGRAGGAGGGGLPAHLRLGHIAHDDWETVRRRARERATLRAVRAFGPRYVAEAIAEGPPGGACDGYCATCVSALGAPSAAARVDALMARPGTQVMAERIGDLVQRRGADGFLDRHTVAAYRHLAHLGGPTA